MYQAHVAWKKPLPDRVVTVNDHGEEIARAPMRKGEDTTTTLARLGLRAVGTWREDEGGGSAQVEPRWDELPTGNPRVGIAVDPFRHGITMFVGSATASLTTRDSEHAMEALGEAVIRVQQLGERDDDVWVADEARNDPGDPASNIRARLVQADKTVTNLAAHLHEPTTEVRQRLAGEIPFADHEVTAAAEFLDVDVKQLAPRGFSRHGARPVPVFPLPVREYSAGPARDGEVRLHGYCAWFCGSEVPAQGASVADHGRAWCESLPLATMSGTGIEGRDVELYVALAKGYHHGFYRQEDLQAHGARYNQPCIHFLVVDAHRHRAEWMADSGQARRLAAGLVHAADVLERLTTSPRLGK